jgi:hypothetical protein
MPGKIGCDVRCHIQIGGRRIERPAGHEHHRGVEDVLAGRSDMHRLAGRCGYRGTERLDER